MLIDIVYVLLLIVGFYLGFRQGLVKSLFAFFALTIGTIAALKFCYALSYQLDEWFNIAWKYLPIISFILIFIAVVLLFRWVASLLEDTLHVLYLGWVNKIVGAVFWCAVLTFIYSVSVWFADSSNTFTPELTESSVAFPFLVEMAPEVVSGIGEVIPILKDTFEEINALMDEMAGRA